jgi:membrane protein implicated in regulation of membrane protease activity
MTKSQTPTSPTSEYAELIQTMGLIWYGGLLCCGLLIPGARWACLVAAAVAAVMSVWAIRERVRYGRRQVR